jgi:hypothetical protein
MIDGLLEKVKANAIITHGEDDELIRGYIHAALDYAETYQKAQYSRLPMPPSTEQAVIILASHFYESRDGGTGGFFADNVGAARQTMDTVNALLRLHKNIEV